MREGLVWALKAVAIWAALLAGSALGSMAATPRVAGAAEAVPLGAGQAFLLVNALVALVLAAVGGRMTGPFWRRTVCLFLLLYVTETVLSIVESLFFGAFLHLPEGLLAGLAVLNLIKSILAALVAASLWRREGQAATLHGLPWKLPTIVLLYVLLYFGAGRFIAWQSETVRAYYGEGLAIDTGLLALLQIGRGAVWAGLAWMLARTVEGSALARASLSGVAFAIIMAAPLLFPNALMPWAVRRVHLVEIGLSNFLFGLLAVWLLAWKGPQWRSVSTRGLRRIDGIGSGAKGGRSSS